MAGTRFGSHWYLLVRGFVPFKVYIQSSNLNWKVKNKTVVEAGLEGYLGNIVLNELFRRGIGKEVGL
jgi:hypothetical protein